MASFRSSIQLRNSWARSDDFGVSGSCSASDSASDLSFCSLVARIFGSRTLIPNQIISAIGSLTSTTIRNGGNSSIPENVVSGISCASAHRANAICTANGSARTAPTGRALSAPTPRFERGALGWPEHLFREINLSCQTDAINGSLTEVQTC